MYFRENDKIVEHYSNEGLDDGDKNKFPWWLLILIIIIIAVIACCTIGYLRSSSSKGRAQNFGFKFF